MAKNKGLTPKRKKIDRNPRVKHREKFRRAQIRRKGQVHMTPAETTLTDLLMSQVTVLSGLTILGLLVFLTGAGGSPGG